MMLREADVLEVGATVTDVSATELVAVADGVEYGSRAGVVSTRTALLSPAGRAVPTAAGVRAMGEPGPRRRCQRQQAVQPHRQADAG